MNKLFWFISILYISTSLCLRKNEEFSVLKGSLKCESKKNETAIIVGDSVRFCFKASLSSLRCSLNDKYFYCYWSFKPSHNKNYVELYFNNLQPDSCYVSHVNVYVSGVFSEKICDKKKVEGLKFVGRDISIKYIWLKATNTSHLLDVVLRETSPVNTGCDFKTREIGYRYHLLYEVTNIGRPTSQCDKRPVHGSVLKNVSFTLSLVNSENLGVTPCFDDIVILPNEDIPSCHSAVESGCGWEIGDGVNLVYEVSDLKGYHWKITGKGIYKSKNTFFELESICIYVEYLLDAPGNKAVIKLFAMSPQRKVLLTEHPLKNHAWETARITSSFPDNLKDVQINLILEVTTDGVVYINKIFGCNPLIKEDRHLISTGNNILLFGSIEKEFLRHSKKCTNGGLLFNQKCICAIGFHGDNCEYACGENKFGPDCQSHCSLFNCGCKQIIFCDDVIGCSCASGFTGEYCHIGCTDYYYGANCRQKCGFCLENAPCDSYTGYCNAGCKRGYLPPYCFKCIVHFIKPPNITNISLQEVTAEADINERTVAGADDPSTFIVQYKENQSGVWMSSAPQRIPNSKHIIATQKNLTSDVLYNIRFIILTKTNESIEDKVPFTSFNTLCRAYIKYIIKLEELWISGAKISWQKELNSTSDCNIKENDVLITSGATWKKFRTTQMEFEFTNLLSDATYKIKIKPILNQKSPYSYFSFTTPKKCSGEVKNVQITEVGSHNADIKWDRVGDKYVINYMCLQILADPERNCSTEKGCITTGKNKYHLTKLHPNRKYQITVKEEMCLDQIGYKPLDFITKVDVPTVAPGNISINFVHSRKACFSWSLPTDCSECNGAITGYHIEIKGTRFKKIFAEYVKSPYLYIEGLLPNKSYILYVFLINEAGWNNSFFKNITFTTKA